MGSLRTEWNLGLLLKEESKEFVEKSKNEVEKAAGSFAAKWNHREDYLNDAEILKEALDEYEWLIRHYGSSGDAGFYFWLKREKEQDNANVNAGYNQLEEFNKKMLNQLQFFELKLGKINRDRQENLLSNPLLKDYKHFLERIFAKAKYMLSDEEEKIINLMEANSYSKWVNLASGLISRAEKDALLENGKIEKRTFEAIMKLTFSGNKKVRDFAAEKINEVLIESRYVAESELNAVLAYKKNIDELRGFERPDKGRHINDDIDSEIVDALIGAVTERFNIAHKHYSLKAKLLGVERLQYHERNVEFGKRDKKYAYEDSIDIIHSVFNALDAELGQIMKNFIEEGRVDVYPKKGKRGGAFCAHSLITEPVYLLLNHTDRLSDVTIFAHELGHGINYELMKKNLKSSLDFGTCLTTAEVASTFMEDFVLQEILKKADDELKLSIMVMKCDDFINTIIRQIACYRFEKELHEKFRSSGYLSADDIGKIFQKNMAAYMGPYLEQSHGSENWWIHWWHIRESFYVYSYASGLLISMALQNEVKKNPAFIMKVKDFLSAGLSDSPRKIFMKMGIDISKKEFWNKGLDEIEYFLNETEKLAKKAGKL